MSSLSSTDPAGTRPGPGRPPALPEAERRRRILDAAEQVFTRSGYRAATMEEVARIAGMSKKTVYALFADKRQLLAEVVSDTESFTTHVERLAAERTEPGDPLGDLRHRLITMTNFVLSPHRVRMSRLLIAEAEHAPELADRLHKSVVRVATGYLIEGVRNLELSGVRLPDDLDQETLAKMIFGAVLADSHIRALFGLPHRITREELLVRIDIALGMAFAPGGSAPPGPRRQSRSAEA